MYDKTMNFLTMVRLLMPYLLSPLSVYKSVLTLALFPPPPLRILKKGASHAPRIRITTGYRHLESVFRGVGAGGGVVKLFKTPTKEEKW